MSGDGERSTVSEMSRSKEHSDFESVKEKRSESPTESSVSMKSDMSKGNMPGFREGEPLSEQSVKEKRSESPIESSVSMKSDRSKDIMPDFREGGPLSEQRLNDASITAEGCGALASALTSNPSHLIELNLSGIKLGDPGVKHISAMLHNPDCKLQKLLLSDCGVTAEGYASLVSALTPEHSHLVELDLRGNDPGDSGVKLISDLHNLVNDKKCKLQTLRLLKSDAAEKASVYLTSVLGTNPLCLAELNLSKKKPGDSGVKQLCALLKDSHCKLKKLTLNDGNITGEGCSALMSALTSNPSHLVELNLSGNKLGDSGVKYISALLKDPLCKLEKLELHNISITDEGCSALTSSLTSNPSHLIELNLSGNELGDSGVKHISALLESPDCELQKLLINDSGLTEKGCGDLALALRSKPTHLIELDLSVNKLGDSGVKHISALLENTFCKLQRLRLNNSSITADGCAALVAALTSNPAHLIELNLSGNKLGDSGVKHISALLGNPECQLQKLLLNDSSITEESCDALASALRSNPSDLIELNLSGNKLGDSGVKHISALLENPDCKLQKLLLIDSSITDKGCATLVSALKSDHSHLIELNLTGNELGDSGVNHISDLLKNPDCKLQKLLFSNISIADEGCAALTSALTSNPSHLVELNLSGNKLGDLGVLKISALLENPKCKLQKLLLSDCSITGDGYAALASALKSEHSHLIELDLRGNYPGHTELELVRDLHNLLNDKKCKLETLRLLKSDASEEACAYLTSVLGTNPLLLTDLDLSGKKPGVKQFCALLGDSHCRLQKLKLNDCSVTDEDCAALTAALASNPSHLMELNLSGNKLGDSGVKHISALLQNPDCKLQKLLLSECNITGEGYAALASALKSNPSHLVELDLTGNDPGDSGVELLTNLKKNPTCNLNKLRLLKSDAAKKVCSSLIKVHGINPLLVTELDLSGKKLGDSVAKQLSAVLEDSHCKLQTLKLADCGITGEGYAALASALKSNPSHLIELDLRGNDPGDSAVKLLTDLHNLVYDRKHKLKILRLLKSDAAEEASAYLTSVLRINPLLLTDLDLSKKKPGDLGVQQFCALLEDSHCKLKKLKLNDSGLKEEGCAALIEALKSNPSHLVELNLSGNELRDSGVNHISALLKSPHCKLQKLLLNNSRITEKGSITLASALKSNPSHLIELNLSGNELGDTGVKQIFALLKKSKCKLHKLLLSDCSVTEEGCAALAAALRINPSHLIELNLSGNELGDSGVKHITALLKDPCCKLEKLLISHCGVTGEGYASLASALKSEHSNLIELNLRGNDPGPRGVTDLLNIVIKNAQKCDLKLLNSDAAEKACAHLTSVLGTNPLFLTELDLSEKKPGDSGVKQISALLEDSLCKLQRLRLYDSNLTDKGCVHLIKALTSNPSHLKELNLSGNKLGDSGVKHISVLLEKPDCKLEKLQLHNNSITAEGCAALTSALISNPSHLIELDLSGNKLGDSGVKHISALLEKPDCKLQKLLLNDSIITNKGGDALTEAVTSDPLLHLKGNKLGHSGEKQGSFLLEYPTCKLHLPKEHCGCKSEGMKSLALKKMVHEDVFDTFTDLKRIVMKFMNDEWERFKRLLKKEKIKYNDRGADENQSAREAALNITLHFLKKMNRNDLADTLENCPIEMCQRELKSNLKKKYECVFEGIATQGKSELLERIYTDLFITKGGSGAVNKEHEVRHIEKASGSSEEKLIECNNIFQSLPGEDKPIRTVLTKGVAGIGKSISVQKFILDWLKGNANQDIDLIFPLPFRELNLKVQRCTFMDILHQFFPETKGLMFTKNNMYKVLFVFDGLDECRHPLAFKKNEIWSDLTTSTSVDVLLTNLIKGNLFPSALIWITSRPAAAGCIPPDYIDQVAEIRGFNEEQKEEYFRKRITDGILADKVIQHMKESRSLYIMCHIPVFCWISATVLERILEDIEASEETESSDKEQTLKTLTQMYSHFLIFQTRRSTEKYGEKCAYDTEWDEKSILALGQLAFQNLLKNNLIFCENDLMQCGITVDDASVYSGVCTQIFKQDSGVFIGTAFCFVHLSIQEFFAALYSYMSFNKHRNNVFVDQDTSEEKESRTVTGLLKSAVDKALKSDSGHFDLFLRFLLGLSLESNQKLLEGLLIQAGNSSQEKEEIVKYIKEKFKENPSPERSINLFYCLNELNDKSLVEEIQNHLRSGSLSSAELSPAQWSALVFVLLTSEEQIEEFDLKKYIRSDECLRRLLPVVKTATKAFLDNCNLTLESCSALATVLSSSSTSLKELNLSNNEIKDSGVQVLAEKLGNPQCKLESLRLSDCGITGKGYIDLAVALKSNPSHLKELDLTGNDPGDSGVKLLTDLLNDKACKLVKLRFLHDDAKKACDYLTKVLDTNPLLLTELDLSGNIPGDSGVKEFSALLEDSHCKLQKLKLNNSLITEEGCAALTSALCGLDSKSAREEGSAALTLTARSKPSCLIELNLSGNELGDSGVKHISALLETPLCKLQRLDLSDCSITGEGYAALASALKSNHSQLIELDLRGNNPGDSGVKLLTDLVQDPACKLVTLRLLKSDAAEEACEYLRSVLGTNPLLLKELDLTKHTPGDSEVKQLSALLEDSQCTLAVLKLNDSSITDEGCAALTSALTSNPSHLIELNLSGNKLGDSGVKHISTILQNSHCKLKNLLLSDCNVTGEGYADLLSALKSNHSQLEELDLRGNDSGVFGVELLTDFYKLLNDQTSKLQTLRLLSDAAGEAFEYLTEVLGTNPLLQTELDLSEKKPGDSEVKQFCALLGDSHCKLKSLKLNSSSVTEEGCAALTSALRSNPSHLIQLNLNGNELGDSGVKHISALLEKPDCNLKKLELSDCNVTGEGYAALTSALKSNPSHLVELDLRGNDPGESGVELLTDFYNLINDPNFKLQTLRLLKTDAAEKAFAYLISVLDKNPLLLTELDLSEKKPGNSGVKQFSALLEDSHCKLKKLKLNSSSVTEEGCAALTSALRSNPSHLIQLNLSGNNLGDSGVKHISALLEKPECKLEKLKLSNCSITTEGYTALASALKSNHSYLVELDLSGNDPGDSGVKHLSDLQLDPDCKLKKIRWLKSEVAEKACDHLTKVLGTSPLLLTELDLSDRILGVKQLCALLEDSHCRPQKLKFTIRTAVKADFVNLASALKSNSSHLKELDLSGNKLGNSGVKYISGALQNPCCKLEKLKLDNSSITEDGIADLASTLPSNLIELNLSGNNLGDSGVTHICTLLQNQQCTLKKLNLSDCDITGEGYTALVSVLKSNPSQLKELDLRGNKPGKYGVKQFLDLLQVSGCELKRVRLLKSDAEKARDDLTKVLKKDPLLLKELDLSEHTPGDSGVKQLSVLLQDSHCTLMRLQLNNSSITADGCAALVAAITSNPLHLIELNLSGNRLGDSGVKHISALLRNSSCQVQILKLSDCSITGEGYAALASALESNPSHLVELDLRENDPGHSGVELLTDKIQTLRLLKSDDAETVCEYLTSLLNTNPLLLTELDLSGKNLEELERLQLSALLEDSHCKLKILKLSNCELTKNICSALAKAFTSDGCTLRELDLSNNKLLDSGVKRLSKELNNTHCKLEKLSVKCCDLTEKSCSSLVSVLSSDSSSLTELDLSGNLLLDSGVMQLSSGLKKCKLQVLRLGNTSITEEGCNALASAFRSNPSHLLELNLSDNKLESSGAKHISALIENPDCKLERLLLSNCRITAEGYATLASTVKPNLKELDLRGNDPGYSGEKLMASLYGLYDIFKGTLRLLSSDAAEKACHYLTKVLGKNPIFLAELDLSGNELGVPGVKHISTLLEDSQCNVKTLKLNNCGLTEQNCSVLATILSSEFSNVTRLDVSHNELGDPGVKLLSDGLKSPHCKLEVLSLSNSSMTAEGCTTLTSDLTSNPSHLIELNISKNKIGDLGVQHISTLLENQHCNLQRLDLSECGITGEGYAALTSALKSNPSHLVELDLRGNDPGGSGVKQLSHLYNLLEAPNVQLSTLRLLNSDAADKAFEYLTALLGRNPLLLTELDLSEKKPGDSGVKHICALLQDSHCTIRKLILSDCGITREGYADLVSALKSNPSHLVELDLRGNDPGQLGVMQLTDLYILLDCPNSKLKTLRLLKSGAAEEAFGYLTSVLGINPLLQTVLDLSEKTPGDSGVKQFSALLGDSQFRLQKLKLNNSNITDEGCADLTSALRSNPSHLIELNLSGNKLGDLGVQHISALLRNPDCKLQKLLLSDCSITGEGYADLASALKSNPSHLVELDLRGNDPGDFGVKLIIDIQTDSACKLKTIRFLKTDDAETICNKLNGVLGTNPLLLTELVLSGKIPGDSKVQQFCALLKDSHCKLKKLALNNNNITDEGCAHLTPALLSNLSHLVELSLSGNKIKDPGVNFISAVLKDSDCKLQKLELNDCNITHEGCAHLTSALLANSSHLIELNMSRNKIKDQGVLHISALLQYRHCKLQKLLLNDTNMTNEGCAHLTSALTSNPSHLIELNLSGNSLGDSGVKHISALLGNPECKLQKLELNNNSIAKDGCAALKEALLLNPSHLTELSLSGNKLGDTSAKHISALLKDSRCKLEKLQLDHNLIAEEGCAALASALTLNISRLRELHLKGNKLGDSIKKIAGLQRDPNYKLQTLVLDEGGWMKWLGW